MCPLLVSLMSGSVKCLLPRIANIHASYSICLLSTSYHLCICHKPCHLNFLCRWNKCDWMFSVDCCWLGCDHSRIWCHRKTKTTLCERSRYICGQSWPCTRLNECKVIFVVSETKRILHNKTYIAIAVCYCFSIQVQSSTLTWSPHLHLFSWIQLVEQLVVGYLRLKVCFSCYIYLIDPHYLLQVHFSRRGHGFWCHAGPINYFEAG